MRQIAKLGFVFLAAAAMCSAGSPARAISLDFSPPSQSVGVGDPVDVELVISGLGGSSAPSLGAFELDLTYDPAILGFVGLVFGDPVLGDQLDLSAVGSLSGFDPSLLGTVDLFVVSFDSPEELDSQQAASFVLLTISFQALAEGSSPLGIAPASLLLGDSQGDPLLADSVGSGSVTVVPEPVTPWLVAVAVTLMSLAALRARDEP